jgi:hypothetical protein
METNIKQKILNSIEKIYEEAGNCELKSEFFELVDPELCILCEYFEISKIQAFLVAIVIVLNYKGDSVDLNDLSKLFHLNPIKILEYSDDLEYLHKVNIFKKELSRHRMQLTGTNNQFTINEKITEAILQSKPMPDLESGKLENALCLLEKLSDLIDERKDEKISTSTLFREASQLIDENSHFPLIEKINAIHLNTDDNFLFLYLIWQVINGHQETALGRTLEHIFDNVNIRINYMQEFYHGNNKLLANDWIKIDKANFFNNTYVSISERSIQLLNEVGINLFANEEKSDNIIKPEDIPQRELVFSASEMNQIILLKDMLKPEKLSDMQARLSQKNMPTGITVLLHGEPGTGKTEIVKQISRDTGRPLMKIDISQSKSMWFGESEKIIKRLFTDYKAYAKKCKLTPILFFNEADAILSKRKGVGTSNVAQTENAIQNILLEEIENFEGILFATTNLITNLDKAFDRRFLFKIHFPKPDVAIKVRIWKLKLPFLSHLECESLATQFEFSGGQIDNIVRKSEMREVIYGEPVSYGRVLDFCREETFGESRVNIGFTKA